MNRPQRSHGAAVLRLLALWVGVCLGLLSSAAHAILPTSSGWQYSLRNPTQTFASAEAACADVATYLSGKSTTHNWTLTGVRAGTTTRVCDLVMKPKDHPEYNGSNDAATVSIVNGACPANSDPVTGGCQCKQNFTEQGGQCVDANAACAAIKDKPTALRVTIGYTRTPDDSDTKAIGGTFNPWAGAPVCSGGCTMAFSSVERAYISQEPNAQGLYRNSVDGTYVPTGTACTASNTNPADQAVKTDAPQPECPGYVGEVNGKLGCYGTAQKPVTTGNKPQGVPQPPVVAGNPPAGPVPASGPGSASQPTPSTGNGGPAGGPAGAAVGGKGGSAGGTASGTGTTVKPGEGQEQAACGAPGQPVCAVKVDESGVPASGGDGMSTTGLNTAFDNAESKLSTVTNASGMDTSWGGVPQWFSSASCTPWQLGTLPYINKALIVDICTIGPYVVAVMSFLWVVGTFFAILGMVGRVTGPGVH